MFRPYPKKKDSGVEWLGQVPEHWEVRRLKDYGELVGGAGFPHEHQGIEGEELPFYKVGNLAQAPDGKTLGMPPHSISRITASELRARVIPNGSIVYAKIGAALYLNRRRITPSQCCIDNNMTAFVPHQKKAISGWSFYWMTILDFGSLSNPGAVPSLSEGYQSTLPFLAPPIIEQKHISAFLDRKTALIDDLIAKRERQVELLQEHRTAIISRVVTKGLNPDVPMKDSGVEWFSNIPEHWEVRKLGTLGMFFKGRGISRADITETGVPALTYGDIYTRYGVEAKALTKCISPEIASNAQEIRKGDLLFTASGETIEDIGKTTLYSGDVPGYAGGDIVILRLEEGNGLYISYTLNSNLGVRQKSALGRGDIIVHISAANLKQIVIPMPPQEEGIAVARFLDRETAKIDTFVTKVQQSIEKLREYRQSLISAAVTGKIDVRNWQPSSEPAEESLHA